MFERQTTTQHWLSTFKLLASIKLFYNWSIKYHFCRFRYNILWL